ncbi:major facilitator superfamily domain-containing protein [Plakobranchus ocellatus]|uniref:Lysosomal dipeptide transporter MFSD1 n=1 Tax=Plakobranchus ocellatus TaxID=259542 RepID=A0AAV3XS38_9GAST|nr:major facilitator superfamily domain-containing protein [Plakobranchus ocellatus]
MGDQKKEETESSPLLSSGSSMDIELQGCGATPFCNPNSFVHRYFIVLVLICFLSFGSYFCYDNPAALQDTMINDLDINESKFMAFYSFYSWPNVVLCMFGGYLIDRVFGVRLGAIIFSIFVTCGQVLFAFGSLLDSYAVMCLGRFVFGIGGESLAVAQNTYAVKWFQGKALNMVFGLQLSFSRVGSTVNMNVMQPIYDYIDQSTHGYKCLGIALFVGAFMCIFSLILGIILAVLDKRADNILKRKNVASEEMIKFRDILTFPFPFWLISVICVAYYVAVFPFIGLGLVFFEMKFGLSPTSANAVNSLVYIVSAVASPVFGFLIDRSGKNVFWVLIGILVTLACHMLLAFTFLNPYIAMIIMGLSYSVLASALWPMVALIIPAHQLGTAYGIMQAIQNLGLAVISLTAGIVVDKNGYLILEVFFMAWLCLALIAGVLLYLWDASNGGKLNLSAKIRHLEDAKLAAESEKALQ